MPTAYGRIWMATSGPVAAGSDRAMTAFTSSRPTASASGKSFCRRSRAISVFTSRNETAYSLLPANPFTRYMWKLKARTSLERQGGVRMAMKALLYPEYQRLEITDQPKLRPGDDNGRLRAAACGICGSELEAFQNRGPAR